MTKQEIIEIVNGAGFEEPVKQSFLSILEKEGEVISEEARVQIIDAVEAAVDAIAAKEGIVFEENNEIAELDAEFQKELDDAEKLLSTLDMTERDLDIAYDAVKA